MPARGHLAAALIAALLVSTCSTGPELDVKIDQSAQGGVYLKRISDGSLQAAHPIAIDSSTIALVLNGILIRDKRSGQKESSNSEARRVFSASEIGYLATPIAEGLRRAASDQLVKFSVGQAAGTVYAYGRSLYVTLSQYGSANEAGAAGITNRELSFVPEAAKRPDTYLDRGSTGRTLVIDYALLDRLPAAATLPPSAQAASPAPLPHPGAREKMEPPPKESEIEALRKELQEIKKQLAEQQAERARSQPQKPAPQ